MKAYTKDIIRSIVKGRKRFLALMMITALGVCMLSGLKAACEDLRYSADDFFDKQNLYDISIMSTMGLTKEDIKSIRGLSGVEEVEGSYSETVFTEVNSEKKQAEVRTLSELGINVPYLLEGAMPQNDREILVTRKYMNESGKAIGDVIYLEEELKEETDERNFQYSGFRICGVAVDVCNVNSVEGAVAFRDNSTTDYTFFVKQEAVSSEICTAMYLTLEDTDELLCYSDAYEAKVGEIVDYLENEIKEDREQARYDEVTGEAYDEIRDAEDEMWEEFEKAEAEIADALKEIMDGYQKLEEGEGELTQAERDMSAAEKELLAGERQLNRAESEYQAGAQELANAETQLAMGEMLFATMESELTELEKTLEESGDELEEIWPGAKEELQEQIDAGREELNAQRAELDAGRAQLESGKAQLAEARAQLDASWAELEKGWSELSKGEQEIYKNWDSLEEGRQELEEGQLELDENVAEYEKEKADALEEVADAKQEVADLKMTAWYITTRTALSGYNNIKTDADCIEAIGNAFPIIFLTIAILISLTTISRMVEEDRGLIGTYKALGFTDKEIRRKYSVYALLACILGGILGDVLGFIVLPEIIFIIFGEMYQLPYFMLSFNYLYGIGGIILFVFGIVGAAIVSCETVLSNMPAALMRAKAPSNGSRVLLERITPIWSKLSFLNKVTARNLFRYKKRLFMTLFGIAGCTALLVAGFTIKDTLTEILFLQYDETCRYDAMIVAEDNDKMLEYLEDSNIVRKYINTMVTNVKVIGENGKEETVQLIVTPGEEKISRYIRLYEEDGTRLSLTDEDVYATINLSNIIGFEKEDFVEIQTLDLEQSEVEITGITMNYLGNNVYMNQAQYEENFGEFEANAAIVLLKASGEAQNEFVEELKAKDGILSAVSVNELKEEFEPGFRILNLVVYIVIVLAAALAFVVLFTLATTNISERERELATIKVLGFFDNEVHSYVNKETLILTSLGIIMGLPIGRALGVWLMSVLNMPSIHFKTTTYPQSYVYSALLAITFAFIVNFMTDKSLDKINPVEALKSVE